MGSYRRLKRQIAYDGSVGNRVRRIYNKKAASKGRARPLRRHLRNYGALDDYRVTGRGRVKKRK